MEQSCDTKFETHVRYDFNVSGTLSFGQIDEISGVVAQDLFLWFPVKGIRVDIPSSGLIYFDVGVVFKQFSLSLFETPRDCTVTAEDSVFAPGPDHLLRTNSVVEVCISIRSFVPMMIMLALMISKCYEKCQFLYIY